MKKITKAAIAGTVGAALLVGGAGSLAFWTDTDSGPQVQIQSGNLDLGNLTTATTTWTIRQNASGVNPGQAATPVVNYVPGTDKIVPGDVLTTTVNVPVTLVGKNLKAALTVTPTVTAVTGAPSADAKLAAALSISVVSINGSAPSATNSANLTPANITAGTVPVQIAVTFPWTADNDTKIGNLNFQAAYNLTQIPVATP
ncbi:alternate-type signal peptide domain-containing protein [Microterricola viridarii]|uniref:Alternate signal-mediated exported protein, RER_14450 family n=1 Tax=Microterricola viridarii TaxID=412690 RepID=A0A0Y0P6I1_9MICO|nr:alternate-type signal peptide domain-containing protein [Microterricola viridarii]AMB59784.1 hypothetical protein AWU67_13975 [Microterricola viridarii]